MRVSATRRQQRSLNAKYDHLVRGARRTSLGVLRPNASGESQVQARNDNRDILFGRLGITQPGTPKSRAECRPRRNRVLPPPQWLVDIMCPQEADNARLTPLPLSFPPANQESYMRHGQVPQQSTDFRHYNSEMAAVSYKPPAQAFEPYERYEYPTWHDPAPPRMDDAVPLYLTSYGLITTTGTPVQLEPPGPPRMLLPRKREPSPQLFEYMQDLYEYGSARPSQPVPPSKRRKHEAETFTSHSNTGSAPCTCRSCPDHGRSATPPYYPLLHPQVAEYRDERYVLEEDRDLRIEEQQGERFEQRQEARIEQRQEERSEPPQPLPSVRGPVVNAETAPRPIAAEMSQNRPEDTMPLEASAPQAIAPAKHNDVSPYEAATFDVIPRSADQKAKTSCSSADPNAKRSTSNAATSESEHNQDHMSPRRSASPPPYLPQSKARQITPEHDRAPQSSDLQPQTPPTPAPNRLIRSRVTLSTATPSPIKTIQQIPFDQPHVPRHSRVVEMLEKTAATITAPVSSPTPSPSDDSTDILLMRSDDTVPGYCGPVEDQENTPPSRQPARIPRIMPRSKHPSPELEEDEFGPIITVEQLPPHPAIRPRQLQRASENAWAALTALQSMRERGPELEREREREPVEYTVPAPPSPTLAPVDEAYDVNDEIEEIESMSMFSQDESRLDEPTHLSLSPAETIEDSYAIPEFRLKSAIKSHHAKLRNHQKVRFEDHGFTIWRDEY